MQQKKQIVKKSIIFIIGTLFQTLPFTAHGMKKPRLIPPKTYKLEDALAGLNLAMETQEKSSIKYDAINTKLLVEKYHAVLYSIAGKILVALGQDDQSFPLLPSIPATDVNKAHKEEYRKNHTYKLIENLIGDLQEHFIVLELSVELIKNIPFEELYYMLTIPNVIFIKFNELENQDGFGYIRHFGLLTKLISKFMFVRANFVQIPKEKHKQAFEKMRKELDQQLSILQIKHLESLKDSMQEIKGYEDCLNKFKLPPPKAHFSPGIIPVLCKLVHDEQEGISAAYYRFTHHDLAQAFMKKSNQLKQRGGGGNPTPVQLIVDKEFKKDHCQALIMLLDNNIPVTCNGNKKRFKIGRAEFENMHHKFMILHQNKDGKPLLVTGSFNPTGQANTNSSENIVIISDPEAIAQHQKEFEALMLCCRPVTKKECDLGKPFSHPYTAQINGFSWR